MSRVATITLRYENDLGPAKSEFERFVKEITANGIKIPISASTGGGVAPGGTPTPMTIGGGTIAQTTAGLAAPNWAALLSQQANQIGQSVAQAVTSAVRGGGGRGMGGGGAAADEFFDEGKRSRAFAWANRWDRVGAAGRAALQSVKFSEHLARTAGTYGDPGAALDEAISEGAAMEEAAYPGAIAAANARRGGGAAGVAGVVGLGLLGRGPFRRIGGRFAAAYGIYAGIQAVEAGIRGAQGVSLADQFGGAEEQIAARQRAYEGVMNAVPIIGPFSDALAGLIPGGGSAEFEKQKAEERRAAARTTAFIERGNEGYRSIARTAEINEQTSAVGVRNPFAQRFQEIRAERSASERAFDLRQHELEGALTFARSHGSDNDIAIAQSRLDAFGANRGREETALSRLFGAKSRDTERDYDLALRSVEQQTRGFTHAARISELERQRNPNGTRDENAYVDALEQLENTHFRWEREDVRLEQRTRRAEIAAGMERNPLAAETAGIVGTTRQRFRNLMRSNKEEEAEAELKLGIGQLQLTQRDALLSFRGVTLPSQNFETRDLGQRNADFGEQLKSLDDGIKELVRLMTTLVEED